MYAQKMLPGGHFLIGVSGGADSVCLLLVLQRLAEARKCRIRAVHVHHGLRDSADDDQKFVQDLCHKLHVQCDVARVDAGDYARETGMGVEEAARALRYHIFERYRSAWEREENVQCKIAVAHHMEDQAETVLFHLCRGSNLAGAGGMRPVSGNVVRPLLQTSRREIENFLSGEQVVWRTDESNADTAYMRNLLRLEVMPRLREVNSRADTHLCEFAQEAQEIDAYMAEQTALALERCGVQLQSTDICLSIDRLRRESQVIQKRVLYETVASVCGRKKDIGARHILQLMNFAEGTGYGELSLPYDLVAVREYDRLMIGGNTEVQPSATRQAVGTADVPQSEVFPESEAEYSWRILEMRAGEGEIPTKKYTKWFDYDKISSLPVFRTRQPGDRITVTDDGLSKKLSRYMIDEKISRICRDRIVLPMCGQDALWIPGYRMNAAYKVTHSTRRILEIKWLPGESIQ